MAAFVLHPAPVAPAEMQTPVPAAHRWLLCRTVCKCLTAAFRLPLLPAIHYLQQFPAQRHLPTGVVRSFSIRAVPILVYIHAVNILIGFPESCFYYHHFSIGTTNIPCAPAIFQLFNDIPESIFRSVRYVPLLQPLSASGSTLVGLFTGQTNCHNFFVSSFRQHSSKTYLLVFCLFTERMRNNNLSSNCCCSVFSLLFFYQ